MSENRTYTVTGMSCGHCESTVSAEVNELSGVEGVQVSAAAGTLALTVSDPAAVTDTAVISAVDEAGYEASRSA